MLGKLIKHEWIATRRILLPVTLTIILITLVGCIFLGTDILRSENSLPLVVLLIILYALSMIVLSLTSSIYLLVRFYRNLFSAEGYLMFTLPVKPVQLLNSKLIVACLWSFFSTLLTLASLFALAFSSGYYSVMHSDSAEKEAFLSDIISVMTNGVRTSASFQDVFGYTPVELLLLFLILIFVSAFFSLTLGYLAIVLGQLVEKHKLACSIVFYIALYIGTQVIFSMALVIINMGTILNSDLDALELTQNIYHSVLSASTILYLVLGILFYLITFVLIRKKVNLD